MSSHVVESTSELSAYIKAGVMAGSEKDAGFCSGGDEDDMSSLHSPSASEDSVEVQVTPISLRNKRKLAEPRRIQEQNSAPLKKRRYEQVVEEILVTDEESRAVRSPSPFRPWSSSSSKQSPEAAQKSPARVSTSTLLLASPLAASDTSEDKKEEEEEEDEEERPGEPRRPAAAEAGYPEPEDVSERLRDTQGRPDSPRSSPHRRESRQKLEVPPATPMLPAAAAPLLPLVHPRLQEEPLALVLRGELPRVPSHPGVTYDRPLAYPVPAPGAHQPPSKHNHHPPHHPAAAAGGSGAARQQGGQQRNYKNMTRERRIEANARERTRVHTISAAFDTLRRAIPAYSHNQKLSKLSVLRIACSYIMTLGKIVNTPEGESANGASLGACVDLVSRTIQTEGKLRKRKED